MQDLQQFLTTCGLVGAIALFVVDLAMAGAIGADALARTSRGKPVALFGPLLWFFATVIGSFVTVALYWVMHYSSLRHAEEFPSRA